MENSVAFPSEFHGVVFLLISRWDLIPKKPDRIGLFAEE
jgi:hypothetical protein